MGYLLYGVCRQYSMPFLNNYPVVFNCRLIITAVRFQSLSLILPSRVHGEMEAWVHSSKACYTRMSVQSNLSLVRKLYLFISYIAQKELFKMQTFVPAISNKYGYSGLSTQANRVNSSNVKSLANLPTLKGYASNDVFFRGDDTQPSSNKRKAQNRAAQRAFRERREKQAKDLEQRADELTRITAEADAENKLLREQLESGTRALEVYKTLLGPVEEVTTTPNFSFPPHSFKTGFLSYESKGLKNHLDPGESKFYLPQRLLSLGRKSSLNRTGRELLQNQKVGYCWAQPFGFKGDEMQQKRFQR